MTLDVLRWLSMPYLKPVIVSIAGIAVVLASDVNAYPQTKVDAYKSVKDFVADFGLIEESESDFACRKRLYQWFFPKEKEEYSGTAAQNEKLLKVLKESEKIEVRLGAMRATGNSGDEPLSAEVAAEKAWRSCRMHALALQTIARDFSRTVKLKPRKGRSRSQEVSPAVWALSSKRKAREGCGQMCHRRCEDDVRTCSGNRDLMTCELAHKVVDKTEKDLKDMTNVLSSSISRDCAWVCLHGTSGAPSGELRGTHLLCIHPRGPMSLVGLAVKMTSHSGFYPQKADD